MVSHPVHWAACSLTTLSTKKFFKVISFLNFPWRNARPFPRDSRWTMVMPHLPYFVWVWFVFLGVCWGFFRLMQNARSAEGSGALPERRAPPLGAVRAGPGSVAVPAPPAEGAALPPCARGRRSLFPAGKINIYTVWRLGASSLPACWRQGKSPNPLSSVWLNNMQFICVACDYKVLEDTN